MPTETSATRTSDADDGITFNDGINDITSILNGSDDPVLNPDAERDENENNGDGEASEEDQLQLDDEEQVETEDDDSSSDDQDADPRGGQFVSDKGKVTLDDGTVLTVADLKRNNLFQRDYTRKTTELSMEREQFHKDREFVGQHAQAVAQQRQVMAAFMQKYLPQAPDPNMARTDPYGYGIARAEYEAKQGEFSQIANAIQYSQVQQNEAYQSELQEIKQTEALKLFERKPNFRDQKKFAEWYHEAGGLMIEKYGFSPQEINDATDHRFYLMMDDLRRLHKALNKGQPAVKGQRQERTVHKPRLLAGNNRSGGPVNATNRQRQVLTDRHRKMGTMESGIAKLATFEL